MVLFDFFEHSQLLTGRCHEAEICPIWLILNTLSDGVLFCKFRFWPKPWTIVHGIDQFLISAPHWEELLWFECLRKVYMARVPLVLHFYSSRTHMHFPYSSFPIMAAHCACKCWRVMRFALAVRTSLYCSIACFRSVHLSTNTCMETHFIALNLRSGAT